MSGGNKTVYIDRDMIKAVSEIKIQNYFDEVILPELHLYYAGRYVNFENSLRTLCPLHNENTPSFHYIPDKNKFHCFGCDTHGSIIDLHMMYMHNNNNIDFKFRQAVIWLYDKFVKNIDVFHRDKAASIDTIGIKKIEGVLSQDDINYLKSLMTDIFNRVKILKMTADDKVEVYYKIESAYKMIYESEVNVEDAKSALNSINSLIYNTI